jgi:hypothetical protein
MTSRIAPRVLLTVALLLGLSAGATTMLRTDVAELTSTADAVVQGTVRRVESRWSGDHRRIVTDVEIQVTEALKGEPGSTVIVTQPGGHVGDIGQVVHGLASFTPGEEVVVFLERRGPDAFQVSAMAQGKFRVQRSADGKTVLAVPESPGDSLLLDPVTHQPTVSAMKTVPLSELKSHVRTALEQSRQPARQNAQEKRQ